MSSEISSEARSTIQDDNLTYLDWFNTLDEDGFNNVSVKECLPLLRLSELPDDKISEIWFKVDVEGQGVLNFQQFIYVMMHISYAQKGNEMSSKDPVGFEQTTWITYIARIA